MNWLKYSIASFLFLLLGLSLLFYQGDLSIAYVDAKYSNEQSQFLTMSNGARVHYRDEGNKAKPAIVLLHGSNASLHAWEPWVAILGNYYRIISLDLPGHGLTGATPDKDYSSTAQINTVNAVVSLLNVDNFVLGGNSMGGGVTWRYTLQYPEKVDAMLLIDSSGFPQYRRERMATNPDTSQKREKTEQSEKTEPPVFFKLIAQPWFRTIAGHIDPYWIVKQGLESAYNNSPVVTDELIERYYELALRQGSREATISRFSGYRSLNIEPVDSARFQIPVLIMWGQEDALIPVDIAYRFARAFKRHTLVIYEDVGHLPMEEIPQRSAADVLTFLESITQRAEETPAIDSVADPQTGSSDVGDEDPRQE